MFNLMVIGDGGTFSSVPSYDYDEDLGIVRYKDVVYDIKYGLWVVRLTHIQKGWGPWEGCGSQPLLTMNGMMDVIKKNRLFIYRLEQQRKKVDENKLAPVQNEVAATLFDWN